jgi:hypothetical protein
MQLGGSPARYDVKLVAGGYLTYVEAHVPAPPGSAAAEASGPVLLRCAGAVSRDLGESEESGAEAFLGALRDHFGGARVDEAELRKALDEKKAAGLLQHKHFMTFEVDNASFQEGGVCSSGVPALAGRCAGETRALYREVDEGISNLEVADGGKN